MGPRGACAVELLEPGRNVGVVVVAGRELAARVVEPEGLAGVAPAEDGGAILDRHRKHQAGAGGRGPELVAERGGAKRARRGARLGACGLAEQVLRGVFDGEAGPALSLVVPLVAHDAVITRQRAGEQRGVADRGLGRGVRVVRRGIEQAGAQEAREAVGAVATFVTREQVCAQLIDGDLHDQARSRGGGRGPRGAQPRRARREQQSEQAGETIAHAAASSDSTRRDGGTRHARPSSMVYTHGAQMPQGRPRTGVWQNHVISMTASQPAASASRAIPTLSMWNSGKLK